MVKKTKGAQAAETAEAQTSDPTTPIETAVAEPQPAQETPPEPKPTKGKRAKADATLETVFAGYLGALEKEGKSDGTISSYKAELVLAGAELGLETRVADLTADEVQTFFESGRVTLKRNGRPKSQLSIDKTRRVLRQALVWAQEAGIVAQAPLPEAAPGR